MQRLGTQVDNQTDKSKDIFGADINYKPENVLRVGCKNIHGFLTPTTQQVKYNILKSESSKHRFQFDLQLFVETNKR